MNKAGVAKTQRVLGSGITNPALHRSFCGTSGAGPAEVPQEVPQTFVLRSRGIESFCGTLRDLFDLPRTCTRARPRDVYGSRARTHARGRVRGPAGPANTGKLNQFAESGCGMNPSVRSRKVPQGPAAARRL